jgi:Putative lumazine-binding
MRPWRVLLVGLLLGVPRSGHAQAPSEREAVRRAALDYIEGFYEGDAAKIRRSIRPEVAKFGFYHSGSAAAWESEPMSFDEMIAYAERVKSSGRGAPPDAPKEVVILDVQDQTAAAKVIAWWGTDYLQLAKYDGRWMILHVLWQSPPRAG